MRPLLLLSCLLSSLSWANDYQSPREQVTLIELYTSEGCSSCPPADDWLSQLKSSPQLWDKIVPVAFHVDYWNWLGWKDRFSDDRFGQRQRNYQRYGLARSVYTPGFFVQGQEWAGWFNRQPLNQSTQTVGRLSASIEATQMQVSFASEAQIEHPLQLTVVGLGFDLNTEVKRGENRGRQLQHDFVVRYYRTLTATREAPQQWELNWPRQVLDENQGFALWVSHSEDPRPIQVLGGWLPGHASE